MERSNLGPCNMEGSKVSPYVQSSLHGNMDGSKSPPLVQGKLHQSIDGSKGLSLVQAKIQCMERNNIRLYNMERIKVQPFIPKKWESSTSKVHKFFIPYLKILVSHYKTSIYPIRFLPKKFLDKFNVTSGIKIKIAGRFYSKIIIPRKTEKKVQVGSMARSVINLVHKASYVNKSNRGSFSVTVWISYKY